jgi:uracil DNA glycosylase superfamily protein
VECPPAPLYPKGVAPPESVRVLFVGVAPPKNGRHFYTDPSDKLRRGLFDVLAQLGRPTRTVNDFIARGFFLVHTAKCAIRGTTKPNLGVSKLCASTHLRREIECLLPDGLCFLSKNIGLPVCNDLLPRWGPPAHIGLGQLTTVVVNDKPILAIATAWPGRSHEVLTEAHMRLLFCGLGLPTWES